MGPLFWSLVIWCRRASPRLTWVVNSVCCQQLLVARVPHCWWHGLLQPTVLFRATLRVLSFPTHREGPWYGASSWLQHGKEVLSDGNFKGEDSAALLIDYLSYVPVQPQLLRRDKARDSSSHLWKCWSNLNHPLPPQQLTKTALPAESQHSWGDLRTKSQL